MDVQWRRRIRRRAQAAIDYLIALLDSLDGDADLEDGGDCEPSLAACEIHPMTIRDELWRSVPFRDRDGSQIFWSKGARDDREDEHNGAEPDVDDELSGDEQEPSLGSFDRAINQDHAWRLVGSNWIAQLNNDLEAEPPMA